MAAWRGSGNPAVRAWTNALTDLAPTLKHYDDPKARLADLVVHLTGLALALVGGGMLLGLAIGVGHIGRLAAAAIYAGGLLIMLGCPRPTISRRPGFSPCFGGSITRASSS